MPLAGHSHSALGGGGLRGVPHTDDVQPRADETPQRTRFTSSLCSNHRHQYAITKEWEWGQQDWGHVEAEKEHRMKAKRQFQVKDNQERLKRMSERQQKREALRAMRQAEAEANKM